MVSDDEQPVATNINRLRRLADQFEAEVDDYRKRCLRLEVENAVLRQKQYKLWKTLSYVESFLFWRPFMRGRDKQLALIRSALEQTKL